MKNSFVLYCDLNEVFSLLTDEEAGQLIKAVFDFELRGEVTEFSDRMLQSAYKRITDSLLRNREKYAEICEKRRCAIQKRWEKVRKMS